MTEDFKMINGEYCKYHSLYKGWELYRGWNILGNHGRMLYFAVGFTAKGGLTILTAKNLSGIKEAVTEAVE